MKKNDTLSLTPGLTEPQFAEIFEALDEKQAQFLGLAIVIGRQSQTLQAAQDIRTLIRYMNINLDGDTLRFPPISGKSKKDSIH